MGVFIVPGQLASYHIHPLTLSEKCPTLPTNLVPTVTIHLAIFHITIKEYVTDDESEDITPSTRVCVTDSPIITCCVLF